MAKEAKKRAATPGQSQGPRTARPDPGINWQPRVEITPIPTERIHQETRREPRVELTPIPPDMLNYYKNYCSPGRGKSWGPTNRPPAPTQDRPPAPADSQPTPPKAARSSSQGIPKPNIPTPTPAANVPTPPTHRWFPNINMESISELDAFWPWYTASASEPPIIEGDTPSYSSSSHPSDYQEASAIDPDYVPMPEDNSDMDDL